MIYMQGLFCVLNSEKLLYLSSISDCHLYCIRSEMQYLSSVQLYV